MKSSQIKLASKAIEALESALGVKVDSVRLNDVTTDPNTLLVAIIFTVEAP